MLGFFKRLVYVLAFPLWFIGMIPVSVVALGQWLFTGKDLVENSWYARYMEWPL